jgi:hypothetical protein
MNNLKKKFTKWYFRKGYTFGYNFPAIPTSMPKAVWKCPWYVKPLLILFSPSVYQMEWSNEYIVKGFTKGLMKGLNEND